MRELVAVLLDTVSILVALLKVVMSNLLLLFFLLSDFLLLLLFFWLPLATPCLFGLGLIIQEMVAIIHFG